MIDDILLQVHRPGQYIGKEWNVSLKDFSQGEVTFGLCFPDLYEIGMSNLGVRIIYGLLNSLPGIVCERFFAPEEDMQNLLRQNDMPLFSLESRRGMHEFDLVGFSLGSELDYTNVLNMLKAGKVPLHSAQRGKEHPLIIGGGPCALNPEPMYEFFDLFFIGEAEEGIVELIDVYRKRKDEYRSGKISKQELLLELSQIEGVYVPSFYNVEYDSCGEIEKFVSGVKGAPEKVRKRFVRDLDSAYFPVSWMVPYVQLVHDRITLEIMRGCPNRCRFCQAKPQYHPLRIRKVDTVLAMAQSAFAATGYEEVSLCGLSVSEYPHIEELSRKLIDMFKEQGIGVSLPSIRAKDKVGGITAVLAGIKKTGLTFAPEAGSRKLREVMGKDFDEEAFFKATEEAYRSGHQHVKMYFMIGLPGEDDSDLDAIYDFSKRISDLKRKVSGGPAQINLSINAFIPKPHTTFQWSAMLGLDEVKRRQDYLRSVIKSKRMKVTFHNRYMSFLEGVLSRGDRRLSKVIYSAFMRGAKFDAWGNLFSFDKWSLAFQDSGVDPEFYVKEKSREKMLPWDFIDVGMNREALIADFNKVIAI